MNDGREVIGPGLRVNLLSLASTLFPVIYQPGNCIVGFFLVGVLILPTYIPRRIKAVRHIGPDGYLPIRDLSDLILNDIHLNFVHILRVSLNANDLGINSYQARIFLASIWINQFLGLYLKVWSSVDCPMQAGLIENDFFLIQIPHCIKIFLLGCTSFW